MADTPQPHGEPIRVTGEQRLHPALRRLGRACIALARWQRDQQQRPTESARQDLPAPTGTAEAPATKTPADPDQERHHD